MGSRFLAENFILLGLLYFYDDKNLESSQLVLLEYILLRPVFLIIYKRKFFFANVTNFQSIHRNLFVFTDPLTKYSLHTSYLICFPVKYISLLVKSTSSGKIIRALLFLENPARHYFSHVTKILIFLCFLKIDFS